MKLTDHQFGVELLAQLDVGYDPLRIAEWADQLFLSGDYEYSEAVRESLIDLFTMQEGDEFIVCEADLRSLANSFMRSLK
jgi:hypothetical protein